ncbi:hypothetical protein KMW28_21125 [Flammeovirga yaeyamensis]|uniref:START domain-containing protein n=1 Tax=Flammeovirga yaeyamensis TaxID=367791 RepID=A0AAX1NFH3_9BACT|nr:hypothetical protein [Flammeovirga yaeyamensis]MBB3697147.1 hypothetical protein [Flammeovirga yaeyamensis]NMF33808.1 hypothetical protein [Flammeovirga yaeyamensis]QWG04928.1 hypothetical protein KMW28_21125 [Flammeovirga yaeyamensis]
MKLNIKVLFILLFSFQFSFAQEWTTEKTENGSITVKSRVISQEKNGKKSQVVEYEATTITDVKIENLLAVLKDASKHKYFSEDTEESKKLKDLPNGEWLVYYFVDAPFPMPNNDLIVKMKEINNNGIISLIGEAAPSLYKMENVKRMTYYNISYHLKDLENGQSELKTTVSMTPVAKAPDFLVRTWLPDGPSDIVKNIIIEAKKLK